MYTKIRELKEQVMFGFRIFFRLWCVCVRAHAHKCVCVMQVLQDLLVLSVFACFSSILYFLSHCDCFHYKLHTQEHGEDLKEDCIILNNPFIPSITSRNNAKTCELRTSLVQSSEQSGACKHCSGYALLTAYMFVIWFGGWEQDVSNIN